MTEPPKRRARMNCPESFPIISEEYAASIGHVAVNWSMVEDQVRYSIMMLLGHGQASGLALTSELPHLTCMNILTALINLAGQSEFIEQWSAIKIEVETLRTMRNDLIHAEWAVHSGVHSARRHKAKGAVTQSIRRPALQLIDNIAALLVKAVDRIAALSVSMMTIETMDAIKRAEAPYQLPRPTTSTPKKAPRPPKQSSAQKRKAREEGGGEPT